MQGVELLLIKFSLGFDGARLQSQHSLTPSAQFHSFARTLWAVSVLLHLAI